MFSRVRIAFAVAALVILCTSSVVFAKGNFSFIKIIGGDLKEEVRSTNPALTTDFFAFADLFQDKTEEPANPGTGYLVTRYYMDGSRETAFDHLHYYPDTGFVYYDGLVDGWSEYDGKWYTAKPEIKTAFETSLSNRTKPVAPSSQSQPITVPDPTQSKPAILQAPFITLIAVTAGLLVVLMFAFWFRRPSTQ